MSNKIYDVIMVGAGLSGLQVAYDIQQAGLSCLVLEARDRVGGKTWSVPLANGKGVVDLGAAWTNDTNQSYIYALIQRFEIELVVQNTEGDCIFQDEDGTTHAFPYGTSPKFINADVEDLERIRDIIHDLSVAYKCDRMSLEQFVSSKRGSKKTLDMVRVWSRVMLGVEASEMSAQFFFEYNGKGTQSISHGLAALLKSCTIHLSTPVTAITDRKSSVTAVTQSGQCYTSRKLILSIPTPLHRDISIPPPLSGEKLAITSGTQLGYYSKMILCYSSPWWTKSNCCGLAISYQKPYSLTCFIGGAPGRTWSSLSQHERRAQVLKQVSTIYKDEEQVYKPIGVFEQEWSKEERSKGAPCPVTRPGLLTKAGAKLSESVGNMHFVGTETSEVWSGYMEGAVRSGVRGALEVVDSLGVGKVAADLTQ